MYVLTKHERERLSRIKIHPIPDKHHEPAPIALVHPEHHYRPLKNPRLLPEDKNGVYK